MAPSLKTLHAAFDQFGLDDSVVPELRELLVDFDHGHVRASAALRYANRLLDGSGVEAIFAQDEMWPEMEYVNMGDMYTPTVVYDRNSGRFKIMSYGDWVEAYERKHGELP